MQYTLALAAAGLTEDESDSDSERPLTTARKLARVREYLQCGARGGELSSDLETDTEFADELQFQDGRISIRECPSGELSFAEVESARRRVPMWAPDDWPAERTLSRDCYYIVDFEQDLLITYPSDRVGNGEEVSWYVLAISSSIILQPTLASV